MENKEGQRVKKKRWDKKGSSKRAAKKRCTDMYIYLLFETFRMIVFGEKRGRSKKGNRQKTGDETKRRIFLKKKKCQEKRKETTKKTRKPREEWKRYRNTWVSSFK